MDGQKYILVYTDGTYVADDPLDGDISQSSTADITQAFQCNAEHAWQCMRKFDDVANALPIRLNVTLAKGQRPLG